MVLAGQECSLREAALTAEHVCKRGLKSALKPWLYSAPRINSSFQQPPRSHDGSGTAFGQAVALMTACLHLESARRRLSFRPMPMAISHAANKALEKGGQSVVTTSFSGGSDAGCLVCQEIVPAQALTELFSCVQR